MAPARETRALGGGRPDHGLPLRNTPMKKPAKKSLPSKPSHKSKPHRRVVIKAARSNTKSNTMLQLLAQTSGATVKELAAATDWQDHSVRGFLSATVKKKLGLTVKINVVDGTRHYRIHKPGAEQ